MNRLAVYSVMAAIVIVNAVVFGFLFSKEADALPTGLQNVNQNSKTNAERVIYASFADPLGRPMDVFVKDGLTYVTDTNNQKVHVFNDKGEQQFTFGKAGNGPGEFDFPYGISLDDDNNIYVADMYNSQILKFSKDGEFIEFFAHDLTANETFISPAGLRIIDNKMYVTDVDANKVFVLSLSGELLLEVGEHGDGEGQFASPNAVTVDEEGNIYVVDTINGRVQIFDKEGQFTKTLDEDEENLVNPRGIGIDSKGNIYVVSNMSDHVEVFDKNGDYQYGFGGNGQELGQLNLPNGLFIDSSDRIYVTDTINLRVSVFK